MVLTNFIRKFEHAKHNEFQTDWVYTKIELGNPNDIPEPHVVSPKPPEKNIEKHV